MRVRLEPQSVSPANRAPQMNTTSCGTTAHRNATTTSRPRRLDWSVNFGTPNSSSLYVVIHGLDSSPRTMEGVCRTILDQGDSAYILVPKMPFEWWRTGDPKDFCHEILDYLVEKVNLSSYGAVRLVGHSAGAAIVQAVYLIAKSERCDHPLASLAGRQLRLILIAPINRGWEVTHHLPLAEKITWMLGSIGLWLFSGASKIMDRLNGQTPAPLWIGELRRGSSFLIWMRLIWLEIKQRADWPQQAIQVVQLLGSVDEIVSWRDMVDPSVGNDFLYFEVPHSDHISIVDYDDPIRGTRRREILKTALSEFNIAANSPECIIPWDTNPADPNTRVARVVFVIHGIRDEGHWTQKIASRARRAFKEANLDSPDQIAVVTSSYGFFSMLQFFRPSARLTKIQWLLDIYTEARRLYPKAEFSFIGHSNGTFLLAHALQLHPKVRFQRVAFAGSVVSSYFNWERLRSRGQVDQVLNFVASKDLVVGLLPRISDVLPGKLPFGSDIGGAGVLPFSETPGVTNRKFRVGGHGTAIVEDNWETLAHFAVETSADPRRIEEAPPDYLTQPHWSLNGWRGRLATVGAWILLLLLFLFLLPKLAWDHPQYLIAALFLPMVIGLLMAAIVRGKAYGVDFNKRKVLKRCAGRIIYVALTTTLIALIGGALANWIGMTGQETAAQMFRTFAVASYFLVTFFVLTRV